jgi:hypothetical protein
LSKLERRQNKVLKENYDEPRHYGTTSTQAGEHQRTTLQEEEFIQIKQ